MSVPHHSTHINSLVSLLSKGKTQTEAAAILGITPSAVNQLADTPQVQNALAAIDSRYDAIEEKLLQQLERTVPMLVRPMEITRVLQVINGAKRRHGQTTDAAGPATVVQLSLPISIQNRFVVNSSNQVVSAGAQDLVTLPINGVHKLLENKHDNTLPAPTAPASPTIYEEDEFGFTHERGHETSTGTSDATTPKE